MNALEGFQSAVAEVEVLLKLADQDVDGIDSTQLRNAVHRAGVVLLVSHFESFLKVVAEDFTDAIGSGSLESRQIPQALRELHTLPRFTEILECQDETQRTVLLKKMLPMMALWNDSAKPPTGTLRTTVLSRTVTNADGRTIDDLFRRMGSPGAVCDGDLDVPDDDGDLAPVDIRFGLSDAVKCRNDIAHGDASRLPTGEDVGRYLRFLRALAIRLDRKAAALIELVGGA